VIEVKENWPIYWWIITYNINHVHTLQCYSVTPEHKSCFLTSICIRSFIIIHDSLFFLCSFFTSSLKFPQNFMFLFSYCLFFFWLKISKNNYAFLYINFLFCLTSSSEFPQHFKFLFSFYFNGLKSQKLIMLFSEKKPLWIFHIKSGEIWFHCSWTYFKITKVQHANPYK
jgi:hypothetical protein